MAIKEALLQTINVITDQDYLRAVTAAGESRNVKVTSMAQTIAETDVEIGGEVQSIASALVIDPDVLDLYESIGWENPNGPTRSLEIPEVEEEDVR